MFVSLPISNSSSSLKIDRETEKRTFINKWHCGFPANANFQAAMTAQGFFLPPPPRKIHYRKPLERMRL